MNAFRKSPATQKPGKEPGASAQAKAKEPVQAKKAQPPASGISFTVQRQENKTGMPDNLKSGLEGMSGHDLSDVRVHYNSAKPAQLNAHAYAQGNQIHLGPGQEKHLPHEGWHVVQQKQGRVQATTQLKKADAQEYINTHKLGIGASKGEVRAYVEDLSNPEEHRAELLRLWNEGYSENGNLYIRPGVEAVKEEDVGGQNKRKRSSSDRVNAEKEVVKKKPKKRKEKVKAPEPVEENSDVEEEEEALVPVRDIFKTVIGEVEFPDNELVKEIAIDWVLKNRITVQNFRLMDKVQVASCFRTAEGLFALLGHGGSTGDWNVKEKMGVALPKLLKDITEGDAPRIYKCGVAEVAHGFSIIVQGRSAELIQSFAGPDGETLLDNINKGENLPYPVDTLVNLLGGLLGDETFKIQNQLFGASIDIEKISKKNKEKNKEAREKGWGRETVLKNKGGDKAREWYYRILSEDIFQWERKALLNPSQIQKAIKAKVLGNLKKLPKN